MDARSPFNQLRRVGFASTCWTTIRTCAGNDTAAGHAREEICRDYWYPLYAYIKRSGCQEQDAADLTQAFFADILGRPWFSRADQSKGRFRSFLLASVNNFLHDHRKRGKALKRSGVYQHVPLDMGSENSHLEQPACVNSDPAIVYEVQWASTIVATALKRLENEYAVAGKQPLYQRLKIYLTVAGEDTPHETVAEALGISVDHIRVSVHRLRKRYGAILREEVARTVGAEEDVEDEIRHMRIMLAAL